MSARTAASRPAPTRRGCFSTTAQRGAAAAGRLGRGQKRESRAVGFFLLVLSGLSFFCERAAPAPPHLPSPRRPLTSCTALRSLCCVSSISASTSRSISPRLAARRRPPAPAAAQHGAASAAASSSSSSGGGLGPAAGAGAVPRARPMPVALLPPLPVPVAGWQRGDGAGRGGSGRLRSAAPAPQPPAAPRRPAPPLPGLARPGPRGPGWMVIAASQYLRSVFCFPVSSEARQ